MSEHDVAYQESLAYMHRQADIMVKFGSKRPAETDLEAAAEKLAKKRRRIERLQRKMTTR